MREEERVHDDGARDPKGRPNPSDQFGPTGRSSPRRALWSGRLGLNAGPSFDRGRFTRDKAMTTTRPAST